MSYRGTLIRSGDNAKTIKGDDEYETAIMYLAPHKLAAARNVCPMAEQAGCIAGCLNTAGRGAFSNVQKARIRKTDRYWADRTAFIAELVMDLERFVRYCERKGVKPVVRLNGTSDIQWEVAHPCYRAAKVKGASKLANKLLGDRHASVFAAFPEIQFYDYTKVYKRVYRELPSNYTLVLSYSEASPEYCDKVLGAAYETGANLAVVFRTKSYRDGCTRMTDSRLRSDNHNMSRPVIDGDKDDLRFLDPPGVIVGLYAKGVAKHDNSGFVIG